MARTSVHPLFRLLRPHTRRLTVIVLVLAALAAANMTLPFCIKLLVDEVFPGPASGGRWEVIWIVLPALGLAYVARNILFMTSRMQSARMAGDLAVSLRSQLFQHLQRMSLAFGRVTRVGPVVSRVMGDTQIVQQFVETRLPTLALNAIMLVALVVVIYVVNWSLAIVATVVLPLHLLTYRLFVGPIRRGHALTQDHAAGALGSLVEGLQGAEVVKGFTGEKREIARFDDRIDSTRRTEIETRRWDVGEKIVADLLIGGATIALLGVGAWHVTQGTMTIGAFFMFFGYVTMLYPAVLELLGGTGHLGRALTSAERVDELFRREPDEAETLCGVAGAPVVQGAIEFRDVGFGYEDGRQILDGLSFTIEPGEHVAITGASGIGKSTLASLIPRFNQPTTGTVLVDGQDVTAWSLPALRRGISIAFQEVFLFDASILENVLYGRYDATVEEIVDACRLTGAHDFIDELPVGYGTTPAGLGGSFSRGERQRLTLARAVLKDAPILILDEATASIDPEEGRATIARILDRMRDRTVIVITHDPQIATVTDRVLTIGAGGVVVDDQPAALWTPAPLDVTM